MRDIVENLLSDPSLRAERVYHHLWFRGEKTEAEIAADMRYTAAEVRDSLALLGDRVVAHVDKWGVGFVSIVATANGVGAALRMKAGLGADAEQRALERLTESLGGM